MANEKVTKEITCLIIDDDPDDQEIFLSVVESLSSSIHCCLAINGKDALKKLQAAEVNPDLIFLDLNMPLMNGRQFLKEIKTRHNLKDIPVIILSTSSDKESISECKQLGAKDFITKPDKFSGWEITLKSIFRDFLE